MPLAKPSFPRSFIEGDPAPFSSLSSSAIYLLALLMLTINTAGCSTLSAGAGDVKETALSSSSATAETAAASAQDTAEAANAAATAAAAKVSFANGDANWIITEGLTRSGRKISFKEVQIDGNGWLVLHPFKDGRPNGAIHVGASYLRDGLNKDITVTITQEAEPQPGEMFLVMLHSDVNDDQVFDFVFVDERNVLDKAVFEGMTMIAHIFPAP